jgi:hypothetical protein
MLSQDAPRPRSTRIATPAGPRLPPLAWVPVLTGPEALRVFVDLVALKERPHPAHGLQAHRLTLGELHRPTDPDRRHRAKAWR